nr:MAG TPA: hypothetical protein [Caudoviricetes sp.]
MTKNQKPLKLSRRKTINDNEVTDEIFSRIIDKLIDKFLTSEDELSQHNIIKALLPLKLSNNMIARIIKFLLPNSNPTSGSVASQIRAMGKKSNQTQELLDLIEKEL